MVLDPRVRKDKYVFSKCKDIVYVCLLYWRVLVLVSTLNTSKIYPSSIKFRFLQLRRNKYLVVNKSNGGNNHFPLFEETFLGRRVINSNITRSLQIVIICVYLLQNLVVFTPYWYLTAHHFNYFLYLLFILASTFVY